MRKILILIQEDQFTTRQISLLEQLVRHHYRRHVSRTRVMVLWNRIPAGQAFTNYQDSRSSLITLECPQGFPQSARITLLKAIEKDWLEVSRQHPDELMLALVEAPRFAEIFNSTRNRLSWVGRIALITRVLGTALMARLRGAPIIINPNME